MLRLDLVERMRQRQRRQERRRRLAVGLSNDIGLRLLPRLLTLPIRIEREDGRICHPSEVLGIGRRILLRGGAGSGRRLALSQIIQSWLTAERPDISTPLPLDLAVLDDGQASPSALVSGLLQSLGQAAADRSWLAAPVAADGDDTWFILLSNWDELTVERRSIWRAALTGNGLARLLPGVLALAPLDERPWPGFVTLSIPEATPADRALWLQHLLPDLPEDEAEAILSITAGERPLFEIALAALLRERGGLPATRAERYRQGLELLPQELRTELYGQRHLRSALSTGVWLGYTRRAERFQEARRIVTAGDYGALNRVGIAERAELAVLAAGLCDESGPLLQALWPKRGDWRALLILGQCLRERPPVSTAQILLILRALGQLASLDGPGSAAADALLARCTPIIGPALDDAAWRGAFRLVYSVLAALPAAHARGWLARFAYSTAVPEALGWDFADRLLALPPADSPPEPPPGAGEGLARWAYVHSLAGDTSRALLRDTALGPAFRALMAIEPARRERAAAALLSDHTFPVPARLAALGLLDGVASASAYRLIERLCADPTREIRLAALAALERRAPRHADHVLRRSMGDRSLDWEVRRDAISQLSARPDGCARRGGVGMPAALGYCARDATLPLYVRLMAVRALGKLCGGRRALLRIAGDSRADALVREAGLNCLTRPRVTVPGTSRPSAAGRSRRRSVLARRSLSRVLIDLVSDPTTPIRVAMAACAGLGRRSDVAASAALQQVLGRQDADLELSLAAITALGDSHSVAAVPALAELLGDAALGRLQRMVAADLLRIPTAQALGMHALEPGISRRMIDALADTLFPAEQPSTPAELLATDADRLRATAAHALASIGGPAARAALINALLAGVSGGATASLVEALDRVAGPDDASALGYVLLDQETAPRTRWLVAQRLADHPAAERLVVAAVARRDLDGFTQAALAEGLGRRHSGAALSALSMIAQDQSANDQLRRQAIVALGNSRDPSASALLLRLSQATNESDELRGLAAAQIGLECDGETRRALRTLLRGERQSNELTVGILRALGRARDRDALPLLLQYSLDEDPRIVQAAIDALAAIGDTTITPALVRISQTPTADRVIRLHAVGALLTLDSAEYAPLVRSYLNSGALLSQMQALRYLIAVGASHTQLSELLVDRGRALPFRLQVLEALADAPGAALTLAGLVLDSNEAAHLRGRAATILSRHGGVGVLEALIEAAQKRTDHAGVRLRVIDALARRADEMAVPALSRIAEDADEHPTIRERACAALLCGLGLNRELATGRASGAA